jgi:hypothetical protein
MSEDETQDLNKDSSPSDKLEENPQPGAQIPGVENPESKEIKKEINPNTE